MRTFCLFGFLAAAMAISHLAPAVPEVHQPPMVMHFYYWNDRLANDSLRAHGRQIGLLSPVWLEVDHNGNLVSTIEKETRSEEHTSELQSRQYLVCRLLLEKKKKP